MKTNRKITKALAMFIAIVALIGCISGCASSGEKAGAAAYPEKNVTIILPYGSGSSQEALLRVACKYVEEKNNLKSSFVISNQEGGSGEIGLTAAYKSEHDGYTLAMFHSPHIALPLVRGEECAFTLQDWAPICNFMTDPGSWLINSKDKDTYPDFASLIEAAKANPGKISVGCGGLNTSEGRLIKQIQSLAVLSSRLFPSTMMLSSFPCSAAATSTLWLPRLATL